MKDKDADLKWLKHQLTHYVNKHYPGWKFRWMDLNLSYEFDIRHLPKATFKYTVYIVSKREKKGKYISVDVDFKKREII